MSVADLIIVGGGIAGLRVGIEALKKRPGINCYILEKYGYVGGRVVTFRKDIPKVGPVQWENGAGRISYSHKKVLKLLDKYKLTLVPLSSETDYIKEPLNYTIPHLTGNKFFDLISIYITPLEHLSKDVLARHTLKELLDKTYGPSAAKEFYLQFPYYSEIHTLRADLAIESFKKEMGSNEEFGVCKEGLSSLIDAMKNEFLERGGKILMDHDIYSVSDNINHTITLDCRIRNTTKTQTYVGKIVVLALHQAALKQINGIKHMSILKRVQMMPLLRIYAVFPVKKSVSWFSGLEKIVTNSPIRYIIPINAEKGIVMISYTDGLDAKYWIKQDEAGKEHGNENVQDLVMTEIRKLFPDRRIPDPIFFKQHPWYEGCSYWLPGNYLVEDESKKSLQPMPVSMPNLFMCGESFAIKQCWMESALDQADELLRLPRFNTTLRNL